MVKKMVLNWKSWRKMHKNLIFKLGVALLFVGLAFRLLLSRSTSFLDVSETPFLQKSEPSSSTNNVADNAHQILHKEENEGKCNIFVGDWIPNPDGPAYTNDTCKFIESHQNCMTNGRPDSGYLYWKWSPRDCELPQLDPERFLEMMRNKTWALIGDSISRNHVQSILCVLSKVELAVEVYHDEQYKSRRWLFPSYNFTLSVVWSPFLAEAAIFEDYNGVSTHEVELHLDKLEKNWTEQYKDLDYIIFSSGKWFIKSAIYHENDKVIGCHKCDPSRNITEIGSDFAYRTILKKVFEFIVTSNHKGMILFRTSTPDHFEDGEWSTGGDCKRTEPTKDGELDLKVFTKVLRDVELEEFEKASGKASLNGVNLKLFDVTSLSLLRPDGHPGPYRYFHPNVENRTEIIKDCLHWCLPGPIDSWNDLLMEMLVNG